MNIQFIFLFLIPLITFSVILEANADETRLKVIFNTRNSKKKGDIITGGLYVDNEKWLQFDENSALFALVFYTRDIFVSLLIIRFYVCIIAMYRSPNLLIYQRCWD